MHSPEGAHTHSAFEETAEWSVCSAKAGVPEKAAILLVGHVNVQMTHEVYLSLRPTMVKSAGEMLDKLLNPVYS